MKKSKISKDKRPVETGQKLEEMYNQILVPMTQEQWSRVTNLEQPNLLRLVPSRIAYSTVE